MLVCTGGAVRVSTRVREAENVPEQELEVGGKGRDQSCLFTVRVLVQFLNFKYLNFKNEEKC